MKLMIDDAELEVDRGEVRRGNEVCRPGRRVFSLLYLLATNAHRVVSKDEIVSVVWDGRAVSDSSLSTAVKEARHLLGDDGAAQRVIRTQHGVGYRCVANVRVRSTGTFDVSEVKQAFPTGSPPVASGPPSLAVLPFETCGAQDQSGHLGDAVGAELIAAMSRLHWLKVTARGSSFRFRESAPDYVAISGALNARYIVSGYVEVDGHGLAVTAELVRGSDASIIWSERLSGSRDDVHEFRDQVVKAVLSALELHIPLVEAQAALQAPENLDAWAEFHIGLRHLYHYNVAETASASFRFERAVALEPTFARAHAGLSFVAFQQAFMHYGPDRLRAIAQAAEHAERSLFHDPLDPFGAYCMGRAKWIEGDLDAAQIWAQRSHELSPSYAHAHYLRGMIGLWAGDAPLAERQSKIAMQLSPLDPIRFGMLATYGSALIASDQMVQAIKCAEQAAAMPEAPYLIDMIAAAANHIGGRPDRARRWAAQVRNRHPHASSAEFFQSFPYRECRVRTALEGSFRSLGL
jgi:TolB-like protein